MYNFIFRDFEEVFWKKIVSYIITHKYPWNWNTVTIPSELPRAYPKIGDTYYKCALWTFEQLLAFKI